MNPLPNYRPGTQVHGRDSSGPGEATLRLIASLPAPEGLADRVNAGLLSTPARGRILIWRSPLGRAAGWMYGSFVRGAAAAAIVGLVAGGGWGIYSRVRPASADSVIVMPGPATSPGSGFSNSGAVRRPGTVVGPVLTHPVAPVPEVDVVEKAPAQPSATGHRKARRPQPRTFTAPVQ